MKPLREFEHLLQVAVELLHRSIALRVINCDLWLLAHNLVITADIKLDALSDTITSREPKRETHEISSVLAIVGAVVSSIGTASAHFVKWSIIVTIVYTFPPHLTGFQVSIHKSLKGLAYLWMGVVDKLGKENRGFNRWQLNTKRHNHVCLHTILSSYMFTQSTFSSWTSLHARTEETSERDPTFAVVVRGAPRYREVTLDTRSC